MLKTNIIVMGMVHHSMNILIRLTLCTLCILTTSCHKEKAFSRINPPTTKSPGQEHYTIASQHIGEDVGFSIVLPLDYHKAQHKQYAVIYYLHGWGGNESSDVNAIQPFVQNAVAGLTDMPVIVHANAGPAGYFGATEAMIIEELIPHIENNFRVKASRDNRTLLGFSMGGTAALRLALKYPKLFAGAASLGGRLWQGDLSLDEAIEGHHRYTANQQNTKVQQTLLLFVQGEQDGIDQFDKITAQLREYDMPFTFQALPNTDHNLGQYIERSTLYYRQHTQNVLDNSQAENAL